MYPPLLLAKLPDPSRRLFMRHQVQVRQLCQSITNLLVKRPFAIAGKRGIVGFREEEWSKWLG